MNALPSAKKFLGLVDLEVLRHPRLKFYNFFGRRAKQFGDMYVFQPLFYSKKMLIVSSPQLTRELASKEGLFPERGVAEFDLMKKVRRNANLRDGLIFGDGPEWKRFRDPTSKLLLRPKFISNYITEFSKLTSTTANRIISISKKDKEDPINYLAVVDEIKLLGLRSLHYFMFHKHLDETNQTRLNEYLKAVNHILDNIVSPKWNQLRYKYLPSKEVNKMLECFHIIVDFTRKNNISSQCNEETVFLQYLQEEGLDLVDILTTFVDFLAAAIETSQVSTEWLWYNLAKYPRVQDKLYEEVSSVLGDLDSTAVTVEHFNKMHYMKMCMKESMRVTPTIGTWARKVLQTCKIGGVEIPKDTRVLADIYSMQMSESYWKDPNEFIPERWQERDQIDPFAYIPFGTGPRMCIGRRIAETEMQLVTAHLCRNARIHLEQEPDPILQTIIKPKDLKLSFERR